MAGSLCGIDQIIGSKMAVVRGHKAEQEDELSVKRGETVELLNVSPDGWWIVR